MIIFASDNQSIMSTLRNHKITVRQLLNFIPDSLLCSLSQNTKVDHYTKILHGKKMFYLLMYGILENDRLSQRTLEDTFNDPIFKMLFNLDETESVCRSSISERLSKIDPDYFKQIYECIYNQFSDLYSETDRLNHNLIRVDSTLIYEATARLIEGINNNNGKKMIKYSIGFDGLLPCASNVFTASRYASEDNALPEVITGHIKQESGHKNIYILDRGLQSARNMKTFSNQSVVFISRSKANRKYIELESFLTANQQDLGESDLVIDSKVHLYAWIPFINKQGNKSYREELIEEPFRLIVIKNKQDVDKQLWLITNNFDYPAKDVTDTYRRRWDIEVFFRFIKQELNVSHLVSFNKNGIEVILYMTLIVAMLVLIYKHANNIGYKTAKRRFKMEVRDLTIAMIVIECGGDPSIFFNKKE